MRKEGSCSKTRTKKKGKSSVGQVLEGGVVQVGALRGQEGANGAR